MKTVILGVVLLVVSTAVKAETIVCPNTQTGNYILVDTERKFVGLSDKFGNNLASDEGFTFNGNLNKTLTVLEPSFNLKVFESVRQNDGVTLGSFFGSGIDEDVTRNETDLICLPAIQIKSIQCRSIFQGESRSIVQVASQRPLHLAVQVRTDSGKDIKADMTVLYTLAAEYSLLVHGVSAKGNLIEIEISKDVDGPRTSDGYVPANIRVSGQSQDYLRLECKAE
jgi:hypothetical protein